MRMALSLAEQGLGRVAPNPSVGCAIVKDGNLIAQARTQDGGRPHAEARALELAGDNASGATAYVTLEPCAHHGKTPPCAQALIEAGITKVFVACNDPDPRVSGCGIDMLCGAGVEVAVGLCEDEALKQNAGFFLSLTDNRPWVTLKMAISSDNKIAAAQGRPVQVSCENSKRHMHKNLRAKHDAIAIGANTVRLDNPFLTTRYILDNKKNNSLRIVFSDGDVFDGNLNIFSNQNENKTIILEKKSLLDSLQLLVKQHDVTRLMVEGGTQLMTSFLNEGLWDELWLYKSPVHIGSNGVSAPDFEAYNLDPLDEIKIGVDTLAIYKNQH